MSLLASIIHAKASTHYGAARLRRCGAAETSLSGGETRCPSVGRERGVPL